MTLDDLSGIPATGMRGYTRGVDLAAVSAIFARYERFDGHLSRLAKEGGS